MSNRIRPRYDLRVGEPWSRKCTKTKHHSGRYGGRHDRRHVHRNWKVMYEVNPAMARTFREIQLMGRGA